MPQRMLDTTVRIPLWRPQASRADAVGAIVPQRGILRGTAGGDSPIRVMSRLLLLWFACVTLLPFAPMASAQASPRHELHVACCPRASTQDGVCTDHGCLGCSIVAVVAAVPAAPPIAARTLPIAVRPAAPVDHRPSFDPPPPRLLA